MMPLGAIKYVKMKHKIQYGPHNRDIRYCPYNGQFVFVKKFLQLLHIEYYRQYLTFVNIIKNYHIVIKSAF